ncbi:MAG TPA: hypothetical protein VMR52_07885 [Dehalococcoidia bacterium]|nr:hypothetical protein [Dehalococcoidia bacterium]
MYSPGRTLIAPHNRLSELTSARAIRASNGDGRRMHYEVNPNALLETPDGDHTTIRSLLHSLDR